jgi:PAS domain S-box-containing protein
MTSAPVSALHSQRFDKVLEDVNVPSYVLDAGGVVRWLNKAARLLVGDALGRQFTSIVAPEDTRKARDLFARKILNTASVTDGAFAVVDPGGRRVSVEVSSVPLFDGEHVVGVFGQVSDVVEEPHPHPQLHLTPRQAEVLDLLERGRSTSQIAAELHLSIQTVRNHVQNLMRALGAHSRLEAVAIANRAH